ncbi:family 43 glycosylhydrolase [uncultured Algibacter sp.]|uniref:family 43 glycosylhydrolase n=1 Tax=uncultured Algibacter sp. TaxID=298659 RepID=UPI00260AE452|nr:family 43 glycosylhydrolase [uncultured Algibacter sp.]
MKQYNYNDLKRVIKKIAIPLFSVFIISSCKGQSSQSNFSETNVSATPSLQKKVDPKTIITDYHRISYDWMRDTYVTYIKEDGYYYLTGTTRIPHKAACWDYNDGLYLWRSKDLKKWDSLGLVWSFKKDATWQNEFRPLPKGRSGDLSEEKGVGRRAVWAPEFHYINGDYYFTTCMNWHEYLDKEKNGRVFLLKSKSGKPEGPYIDPIGKPLANRIDSSLFQDDDGTVYFVWQDGKIAKMKDDMSGFAEEPRDVLQSKYSDNPYIEGAFITKKEDKYYLIQAAWIKEKPNGKRGYFSKGKKISYDCVVSISDNIYGPYGQKFTSAQHAGHNNIFEDKDGNWWGTMFGNPRSGITPTVYANPTIYPLEWTEDGKCFPKK